MLLLLLLLVLLVLLLLLLLVLLLVLLLLLLLLPSLWFTRTRLGLAWVTAPVTANASCGCCVVLGCRAMPAVSRWCS